MQTGLFLCMAQVVLRGYGSNASASKNSAVKQSTHGLPISCINVTQFRDGSFSGVYPRQFEGIRLVLSRTVFETITPSTCSVWPLRGSRCTAVRNRSPFQETPCLDFFKCNNCAKWLRSREMNRGTQCQCPYCGQQQTIPGERKGFFGALYILFGGGIEGVAFSTCPFCHSETPTFASVCRRCCRDLPPLVG